MKSCLVILTLLALSALLLITVATGKLGAVGVALGFSAWITSRLIK